MSRQTLQVATPPSLAAARSAEPYAASAEDVWLPWIAACSRRASSGGFKEQPPNRSQHVRDGDAVSVAADDQGTVDLATNPRERRIGQGPQLRGPVRTVGQCEREPVPKKR